MEEVQKSNLDSTLERLGTKLDSDKLEEIKNYIKSFIRNRKYTVKFLNACSTGFAGVRTKNQVIICSPMTMSLGDFIYTIFHELRHEEQMTTLKMKNPFNEMDLGDLEKLSEHYWNMEMDADKTAKENISKMVLDLNIPIDKAKEYFVLSPYIENYQMASNTVKIFFNNLIKDIRKMKSEGLEFDDIQDHPIIKKHLDKLEDFI